MSASRPFDYRVPAIAGCALFMELLDATAVLTALPEQPGVWGDFKLNADVCVPGAVVCMAEAKGPTGKTQNAFAFCHETQAKADTELSQMRQGDPQAVLVDWP